MGKSVTEFTPLEETALLTEYARALDSRWQRPILGDSFAAAIVAEIDYDFAGLGVPTSVVCQTALRAKMLDDRVRDFIAAHPDAVVVDLGAGLDTAQLRVDPPATVDWYNVDLARVLALRDELVPGAERSHALAASVADDFWPATIPADRPAMVRADGLFAFLPEDVLIGLFRRITEHFSAGQLAFNDYGRVGPLTRVATKLAPPRMFSLIDSQWGYRGFKHAGHPETWNPRLRLVEESSVAHAPEVDSFPRGSRIGTRLAGKTKTGARKARILRYRFSAG